MQIQTKFNIGDTIHFMHNNKAWSSSINGINIYMDKRLQAPNILLDITHPGTFNPLRLREDDVFATKEELIKSL